MTQARRNEIYETLKRISGIKSHPSKSAGEAAFTEPARRRIDMALIGASTGGPRALSRLVSMLPGDFPVPAALVQHNSPGFDEGFAQWLDTYTPLEVKLAAEGEEPRPGKLYVARTGLHLALRGGAGGFRFAYDNGESENNQKPAVDVLFRTASEVLGAAALSVVLTGMGCDGAAGTRCIRERGGITIAQDEESSLIYGMPRAAAETGCVDMVLPLDRIAGEMDALVRPHD
jgi:two-component system chemotaxis response regulator CheB